MIGLAALLVGLLLVLTWLIGGRVPGEASFALPGVPVSGSDTAGAAQGAARRTRNLVRAFVLAPVHPASWAASAAVGFGFVVGVIAFAIVISFFSSGASTLIFGVGILLFALAIEAARIFARVERWRAAWADPRPLAAHAYRRWDRSLPGLFGTEFADEGRWRDVLYVGVSLPLVALEFALVVGLWALGLTLVTSPVWYDAAFAAGASVSPLYFAPLAGHHAAVVVFRFVLGAALLPIAASVSQLVMALHRAMIAGLLCTSESGELRRQVETLRESRSAVLDAEASELRRIERDLHDGAQQRLVMLAIDLGLASEKMEAEPEAAKQLVAEGRQQAQQALAELRNLVRGIAPAILLDRGLTAALSSLASHVSVPTIIGSDLAPGERLPDAIERAAYFVASEALANVTKHSGAARCEVRCRREGALLVIEIWDDGHGGARVTHGGGLDGLAGRVRALEGTLVVTSPAGGPTLVRAELPIAPATSSYAPAPPTQDEARTPGT